ncbi:MAG: PQQ-dependent sugar dehydrogenase [Pseudomonadota bacterium]
MRRKQSAFLFLCAVVLLGLPSVPSAIQLDKIELPAGFSIEIFAQGLPSARQIAVAPNGVVFVGSREAGAVYRVTDGDQDFHGEKTDTIASGLYMPSGVAFRDGVLYIAEVHRVLAIKNPFSEDTAELVPEIVYDGLPQDAHHGWKAIDFGPDKHLYVPVGAPCNVCEVAAPYGSILALDLAKKSHQVYAHGVRNSVGFAWHPSSKKLWFSDNGRDWMGDDQPGCEINRVDRPGQFFGFPYVHANGIADDQFKPAKPLDATPPALVLGAHVAPLGLLFYTGEQFPPGYKNKLFFAQHGSWNRTKKVGYNLMLATIDESGAVAGYERFASGWLRGQAHWGRPVDIEMLADGSLLLSDDYAGAIYRIAYQAAGR